MPRSKRISCPNGGNMDEQERIYALLCCFYLFSSYTENDDIDCFTIEKLNKNLRDRITFYFPWVTSSKDISEPITSESPELTDEAQELVDSIVNYGQTDIEGEIIIPKDYYNNPFNGVWKTRTDAIISITHLMRYTEMRLPGYYDFEIQQKNDGYNGVYASYFKNGNGNGYYDHYEWLPEATYVPDSEFGSYCNESSFVEIRLNGENISDIYDLSDSNNLSNMDNLFEFNIWTDMTDIEFYCVPEEYVVS